MRKLSEFGFVGFIGKLGFDLLGN